MILLVQCKELSTCFVARAHCWLLLSLPSTSTSKASSAALLPAPLHGALLSHKEDLAFVMVILDEFHKVPGGPFLQHV